MIQSKKPNTKQKRNTQSASLCLSIVGISCNVSSIRLTAQQVLEPAATRPNHKSRVRVYRFLFRRMFSDRLDQAAKPSVKERLNANANLAHDSLRRRRPVAGKRPRQDDKWEHDLYGDDEPQLSRSKAPRLDARDLRLKLRKRSTPQVTQRGGVRDLRERLSGSMHAQPVKSDPPRPKPELQTSKPARKSVIGEVPLVESKKVPDSIAKKKSQKKAGASVDGFLRSLGLEKYQIQFKKEEVDMMALEHMTDEDLKVMGLPMGPRKKILSALS